MGALPKEACLLVRGLSMCKGQRKEHLNKKRQVRLDGLGEKRGSECRTRVRTRRGTRKDRQTAQEARRKLKGKKGRSEARMKRKRSGHAALDHM